MVRFASDPCEQREVQSRYTPSVLNGLSLGGGDWPKARHASTRACSAHCLRRFASVVMQVTRLAPTFGAITSIFVDSVAISPLFPSSADIVLLNFLSSSNRACLRALL